MALGLGCAVIVALGFFVYQLGYYVGGGTNCNIWPIVALFVVIEGIAFITQYNKFRNR